MGYLHEQMEKLKWDKRMQRYNIKNGLVNSASIKSHLENLPDARDNAIPIVFKEEERRERANGSPSGGGSSQTYNS